MDLELFDENQEPIIKLVLEIYDTEDDFIPNWWLEMLEDSDIKRKHLVGIMLSIPSIERQVQKLIDYLDES